MTVVHPQFTREDGVTVIHSLSYSEFVASLAKPMGSPTLDALHGAVGLSGEAGEMLDAIKKVWVYNKEPDLTNIIEELGDLRFYWQMLLNTFGLTEEQILTANVEKLQKRYKGGYSDAAAQARADKRPDAILRFVHDLEDAWYSLQVPDGVQGHGARVEADGHLTLVKMCEEQGWNCVYEGDPHYNPLKVPK